MKRFTRRSFPTVATTTTVVGVAGCGGGDGDGGAPTVSGDDYPAVEEWLTETSVGGADGTYDGSLLDRSGSGSITVAVGASGNGGNFAYDPSAVLVSAGTEVRWSWTGEGNPHNVEAAPAEQLGESDYTFGSGEPEGGSGVKFTRTLDQSGIALYHCEPHRSVGMKGGVAVV